MLLRWQSSSSSRTCTGSPVSCLFPTFAGCLASPERCCSRYDAAEKNAVWRLRSGVSQPLRQATTASPRSLLWRQTRLPCFPSPQGPVLAVRRREERRLGLAGRQPAVHQTLRLLRGPPVSSDYFKEVAEELFLDWHAVKELDKQYMREQLRRAGNPAPRVIGIDEIAVAKGHKYRIVVSDLERGRPIWFGGQDRSEESLDEFFAWLGPQKCGKIRLAVLDMWQPFRNATLKEGNAPQATIVYDKF